MPPTKELNLKLTFTADPTQASKAMQQLASDADKVQKSMSRAQQAMPGGGGGGAAAGFAGTVAGYGRQAYGDFMGAAAGAVKSYGAVALAYQVAASSKAAAAVYRDETLTRDQRSRSFVAGGGVPFGETVLDYADTFSGRKRDMQRVEERSQVASARQQGLQQLEQQRYAMSRMSGSAEARANALGNATATTMPNIDRTTAAGEKQFRIESQLLQVRQRSSAAETDAAAASEEQIKAKQALLGLEKRGAELSSERERIEGRIAKTAESTLPTAVKYGLAASGLAGITGLAATDNGPQRAAQLNYKAQILAEQEVNRTRQVEVQRDLASAAQREADANARKRMADGPETLRVEAAAMEDRASRGASAAQRIGMGNRDQLDEARYALERLNKYGFESLDDAEKQAAASVAPLTVSKAAERSGFKDQRYREFEKLAPDDFDKESPEALRRRAAELGNKAAEAQVGIEQDAAKRTAELAKLVTDGFERVMVRAIADLEERVKVGQLRGKVQ